VTPAARLSAAIEVLDTIASSRQPADQVLKAWGVAHRFAGSGDRRAIADRVYGCLRDGGGQGREAVIASLARHDKLPPADIAALFSGVGYAPAALTAEEMARLHALGDAEAPAALPGFIGHELGRTFGKQAAAEVTALLSGRAPVDLRVNGLLAYPQMVAARLADSGFPAEPTPFSAAGLRLDASQAKLAALDAFKAGQFEVQDEGSQMASWLLGAEPGQTVVDYCAGGGGKTLAIGQMMRGQGTLVACDLNPRRLDAIKPRLERARLTADLRRVGPTGDRLEDLIGKADRVLVDAPCSGSGAWRRRPEDAWRLTEEQLQAVIKVQKDVLHRASALVRPGGRLAYVTCSVLAAENTDVAAAFAANHPNFAPLPINEAASTPLLTDAGRARLAELSGGGHTVLLSPRRTGTDGFFIALFQRTS
jgi:16S rRNA (cytosine967-C5)-methyltransferase